MRALGLLFALALAGCLKEFPEAPDADGDGFTVAQGDCDDADELLTPDTVWYADADADTFGDDAATVTQCEQPQAHVLVGGDCDDAVADVHPGVTEVCDGVDQDCNDIVDDGTPGATYYADADADGFGDVAVSVEACAQPEGYVTDATDCDDADGEVNPDAVEVCNDKDDDCVDGADVDAVDAPTWYQDADADGWGDETVEIVACDQPTDAVDRAGDCDDADAAWNPDAEELDCTDPNDYNCDGSVAYADVDADGFPACEDCDDDDDAVNPDATETCNGKDDDCDLDTDEAGATGELTWFLDGDGDGYGDDALTATSCTAPTGHVATGGDCDDSSTDFHPGASETDCTDSNDYDCSGDTPLYADADADGYAACVECDDSDASAWPGRHEECDGVDNDCDGTTDEPDATDATTWYKDTDGDGYGVTTTSTIACTAPTDYVALAGDCDDADTAYNPAAAETDCTDPNDYNCDGTVGYTDGDGDGFAACEECNDTNGAINPDADELCDGKDNDCDGTTDEADATDAPTWYADADRDGYGSASSTRVQCSKPSGYVALGTDCNDGSASISPGASEICDTSNTDEDCDGDADDADSAAVGKVTTYADSDSDGYGSATDSGTAYCDIPAGRVTNKADCDDTTSSVSPGASEVCDSANVDEDCDGKADDSDTGATGKTSWYTDADSDGYGAGTALSACDAPTGRVATSGDCNDASAVISPAATEVCDASNTDEDCDTKKDDSDPSATGKTTYYTDSDADGYGASTATGVDWCDPPSGVVTDKTDCDDTSATDYPGAAETVNNGDDEDCDGVDSCYTDADDDNFGTTVVKDSADLDCADANEATVSTDCDDASASDYPGAAETVNNGDDEDCDGVDSCYQDADNDDYGTTTVVDSADLDCDDANEATVSTDCDDTSNTDYPGASETVNNGDDEDCDGVDSCYTDADNDDYGTTTVIDSADLDCADANEATVSTDCDDTSNTDYPGASETVNNGDDEDCDGVDSCYQDADNDDYGTTTVVDSADLDCADANEATVSTDCDDTSNTDYPGASETVNNGDDEDCDGVDSCYTDADNDDYGTTTVIDSADLDCADANEATVSTDCDDTSNTDYPGAAETVNNGDDEDCDGVDSCYTDADNDDYGTTVVKDSADLDCADANEATVSTDCDDTASGVNPGATETAGNDVDENCDSSRLCYTDADDDSYGTTTTVTTTAATCAAGGESTVSTDCNDSSASINPAATETAGNDTDENCDSSRLCYTDADNDTYGTTTTVSTSAATCAAGGESTLSTDCDDASNTDYPGASETVANGDDEDCDGVDSCYTDADGDNYGTTVVVDGSTLDCATGTGAAVSTDCDDASSSDYPGASESVANGDDEDCDGVDSCYTDADGDNYGTTVVVDGSTLDCVAGTGAAVSTDCNDASSTINPGATETAGNDVDEDCNSSRLCYTDGDNDTYGTTTTVSVSAATCAAAGESTLSTDCNDASSSINPAATETAGNDTDENCDSSRLCYTDSDDDTYGTTATVSVTTATCAAGGESTVSTDCDDGSNSDYPGATESVANGDDEDCDGVDSCYTDTDGDNYGTTVVADGSTLDCVTGTGAAVSTDCDDASSSDYPGASESVANGDDEDCDGVDSCYTDTDGDNYGTTVVVDGSTLDCVTGTGAAVSTDCDDSSSAVNPGATETAGNDVDEDCDSSRLCYQDGDGDGYGTATTVSVSAVTCAAGGESTSSSDCDDTYAYSYPGATELCDGKKNNCSDSTWTAASGDDGIVTEFPTSGAPTNKTTTWSAGTASAAAAVSLPTSGETAVCDGTWYVELTAGSTGSTAVVYSLGGSSLTTLSGDGTGTVVTASRSLDLSGFTIMDGSGTNGGGLALSGTLATVLLDDLLVTGNSATTYGGGLYATSVTLEVTNSQFDTNTSGQNGGGLYLVGVDATIDGTDISGNVAADAGGGLGVFAGSTVDIAGTYVSGNTGVQGGGAYVGGALTCTGSTTADAGFETNTGYGVFIDVGAGTFVGTDCDFGADETDSNGTADIRAATGVVYDYGDDADVSCAAGSCL